MQRTRQKSTVNPPMPWFGMDIGGTLTKLVYFEPADTKFLDDDETRLATTIHQYLLNNKAYGETGIRDEHLQLNGVTINGRIGTVHFIRFPTDQMFVFIQLVKSKGFALMSSTELNMEFHKTDELQSLIEGIEMVTANDTNECYYYEHPMDIDKQVIWRWSSARCSKTDEQFKGTTDENLQYPYVLVNIGSGVSVLVVEGKNKFQRVSGSSIGGGFFHGLCALLCEVESFEEAIELATRGDNTNVDKLVRDIYGQGYESVGLPEETVAASFGKATNAENRAKMSREDLARSALVTTANNIGSIALNVANQHEIDRIVFVGNFLRVNPLAARLLASAMEFWSNGSKKALFLKHEEMALRKVRNNLDRLFDKNLTDLIRGIRNNKENEARYIAACIEEIKTELRQESTFIKANAIEKLAYLQMLGYDISWASFNIIEVMASSRFNEKRVGYLTATQCFTDETDVLMLTTNMIRKDLQSSQLYDTGVALSGLACFATADLSRDLVNDVVNLLSSSRPYVRKKAVLLLYKIFLKYPECLRPTFPRLKERLEDTDSGVQSAAVNVICELARKNPRNYLSLAPVFFKLMTTSSNNWMLIKIIKLFGSLVPLESRLGRKLLDPLTTLINSTSAMSLLYECINTVIAVLISISSEAPGDHLASIQLCVQKLGVLIEDSDQNLKYLGLLAMGKILQTHPKAVQAHKDIVLRCLDDKDESIRLRALDLLYGMVSKKNIMEIVKKLMEHVDAAEGSFYRDELLSRIISICSYNNYQHISNFEWYISVLVELTKVEGSKHGILIGEQIQDVTVRVQSIRHFSVSQMALLVENAHLLLSTNSTQRNNICEVLLAAAWICGEYAEHVCDIPAVLESMLKIKLSIMPGNLLSVYVQNIGKLYAVLLQQYEKVDDWDGVESLDNLMLSKLPEFQYSSHLEAQERACNFVEILRILEQKHANRIKMGEQFAQLFDGELNPVASKAQKRVPIPEGLNLDEWIVEPEPDSESEEESESDDKFPSIDAARRQFADAARSYLYSDDEEKVDEVAEEALPPRKAKEKERELAKRRREFELENNPYYMKSATTSGSKKSTVPKSRSTEIGQELQSPLEIPGVIGLDRYMEQQNEDDEVEHRDGHTKPIVHEVNRDHGEMPENALSTDEDAAAKLAESEFAALDMDLDEPLRDDERLFVPKPYGQPATTVQEEPFNGILKKKKKSKTTTQKTTNRAPAAYKSIESPSEPKAPTKKKKKATRSKSKRSNDIVIKESAVAVVNVDSGGYQKLATNGRLDLSYAVKVVDSNTGKVGISIRMRNDKTETIRRLEIDVMETEDVKLETEGSILLPFELPSRTCNEQTLHLLIQSRTTTQRLRASITYFVEDSSGNCRAEKLDCRFVCPSIRFLQYATISDSSFEYMISSGELFSSATPTCESDCSLRILVDQITGNSNFSVVEFVDDAVTLYAHDCDQKPVCVMLKKKDKSYSVSCKCVDQQLAQSIVDDIVDVIRCTTVEP
ncbi:AP-3 complex subunit delta [Aphelenchoides besseyi]|nr:AP-3 complex subunit delta [Aphelenchoides besseyi]